MNVVKFEVLGIYIVFQGVKKIADKYYSTQETFTDNLAIIGNCIKILSQDDEVIQFCNEVDKVKETVDNYLQRKFEIVVKEVTGKDTDIKLHCINKLETKLGIKIYVDEKKKDIVIVSDANNFEDKIKSIIRKVDKDYILVNKEKVKASAILQVILPDNINKSTIKEVAKKYNTDENILKMAITKSKILI